MARELFRQAIHIVFGLVLACFAWVLSLKGFIILCFAILLFGLAMLWPFLSRKRWAVKILNMLERDHKRDTFPGKGPFAMVVGALLTAFIFPAQLFPALLILAIPDGIATIVGISFGKKKLFRGSKKTWAGSIAFFVSSAGVLFFFTSWALLGAFILTFIELVDYQDVSFLDDNVLLPLATGALLMLI